MFECVRERPLEAGLPGPKKLMTKFDHKQFQKRTNTEK